MIRCWERQWVGEVPPPDHGGGIRRVEDGDRIERCGDIDHVVAAAEVDERIQSDDVREPVGAVVPDLWLMAESERVGRRAYSIESEDDELVLENLSLPGERIPIHATPHEKMLLRWVQCELGQADDVAIDLRAP